MPSQKSLRPIEQARAIARALRLQYITPEVEATAKAALARLTAGGGARAAAISQALTGQAGASPSRSSARPSASAQRPSPTPDILQDSPDNLIALIRKREEIGGRPSHPDDAFSESERVRAQKILADLQRKYPSRQ
jgi:hypothetical protein